jgi:hypothetical protein
LGKIGPQFPAMFAGEISIYREKQLILRFVVSSIRYSAD